MVGATLLLFYIDAPSSDTTRGRSLTTLAGGFGAEVAVTGPGTLAFDASPYDSVSCLFAVSYLTAVTSGRLNAAFGQIGTVDIAEVNPCTSVSIVGAPGTPIYVGYGIPATPASRVRVYAGAGSGVVVGTVTLSTTDGARPLLVPLQGGGIRVVFSAREFSGFNALLVGAFSVADISSTAVLTPAVGIRRQFGAYPISMPFAVGSDVYIWTQLLLQQPITGGGGFPVLLRLPSPTAYTNATIYCPIELSAQDFLTATGQGLRVTELNGLPIVSQIGSSATWAALHPILFRAPASTADIMIGFRVVQATHYTDEPQRRGLRSFPCDNSHLIPMGALTRVDAYGAVETGFVHAPAMTCTPGAGGGLTASKTYYYSAVFTSRNELGRVELSAPATPVKAVLAAGQGTVTLSITCLLLTAKKDTQIEIYRTLADGQTFYLVATASAAPFGSGPELVYTDVIADTVIAVNPVIYTQVGQQLANGFPPASRFGCTGGGRAFLGGLLRGDTGRASKLILGDQPATFCESDAFAIILPADMTGIAWMDSLVTFTAEGIYVSSGEGPTDDGLGDFGTPSRLPFPIGCIEPRSVITVPEGTFFQSNRGLYLLPRGFGEPLAAGDVVMDTLSDFPTITGAVAMVKPTEQTIRWTCLGEDGEQGRQIVYDLVHKAWSIDRHQGSPSGDVCAGQWLDNEIISAPPEIGFGAPRVTDGTFSDNAQPIRMTLKTGDIRPFGTHSRGPVQRFGILSELRSPCTLEVDQATDRGQQLAERVFTGIAPDDEAGDLNYTQVDLGSLEMRSIAAIAIELSEESDGEGLAFIALSIERGSSDGLRLEKPADRIV
jgi:hypothetical protein